MVYSKDWMPAHEFHFRERIEGMTRNSVVLKGDNGEKIYCHRSVFNTLMANPGIMMRIIVLPADNRCHTETLWVEALIPTRVTPSTSFAPNGSLL